MVYSSSDQHQNIHLSQLGIDLNKSFDLIDTVLPFELCLQHKIVPLNIINQSLVLGMVNIKENSILEGVQPIFSTNQYLIKRKQISLEVLKKILAEYVNHQQGNQQKSSQGDHLTFLMASEESKSTFIGDQHHSHSESITLKDGTSPEPNQILPLDLTFDYLSQPLQTLSQLSPEELISALLAKCLKEGVNQLAFEPGEEQSIISWQKNQQVSVIINNIPKTQFEQIVYELKALLLLPLQPVKTVKKVEALRLYQDHRILIRLKIVPTSRGEKVFVYLFWGKNLQVYQKYQLDRLGKEGLLLSQKLGQKIQQIILRSQFYDMAEKDFLPLHQLQDQLYNHLHLLETAFQEPIETLTGLETHDPQDSPES